MASMALAITSMPVTSDSLSFSRSPSVTSIPLSPSPSPSPSLSLSSSGTTSISPLIYCGRGDKKTAKGKRLSLSSSGTTSISPLIYCGRGDKKTAKGKRFNHSFGNARPRNKKKGRGPPRVPVPPDPPRKDKFDDGEVVKIELDESLFSS